MADVDKRIEIFCGKCGSTVVTRDAWAEWDVALQDWQLGAVYDYAYCHSCEAETRLEEREVSDNTTPVLE
jgi:uncharacterized OB-fold protein